MTRPDPQPEQIVESLRAALRERLHRRRLNQREVEQRCGWARGYLSQVLQGRITFSVLHLVTVLQALGETPGDFFRDVFPPDESVPADELRQRLDQYDAAFDELRAKGLLTADLSRGTARRDR